MDDLKQIIDTLRTEIKMIEISIASDEPDDETFIIGKAQIEGIELAIEKIESFISSHYIS